MHKQGRVPSFVGSSHAPTSVSAKAFSSASSNTTSHLFRGCATGEMEGEGMRDNVLRMPVQGGVTRVSAYHASWKRAVSLRSMAVSNQWKWMSTVKRRLNGNSAWLLRSRAILYPHRNPMDSTQLVIPQLIHEFSQVHSRKDDVGSTSVEYF